MNSKIIHATTAIILSLITIEINELIIPFITLIVIMLLDYITGIAQAINGRSLKTENGKLNSGVGFKGIFKKIVVLLMVLIGNRIDITFNIGYVKDIIILSYIFNEFISIIENITALGMDKLPIFDKISKLIKKEVEKDERNWC